MRKLLKYLKDYKKESMIGPLFKLLEACFELVVPLIMANMIDIGIRNGDTGYILRMGSILILFAVLGLSCSLTAQYFAAKASVGFGTALRHDMFRHIQSLSYAEIDRAGSSTLVTRITSDINQVQSGVNLVLRLFLRSPFIVVGAMLMAFTISVKLALIFVVAVPLLSLVIWRPGDLCRGRHPGRGHCPGQLYDPDSYRISGIVQPDCQLYESTGLRQPCQ